MFIVNECISKLAIVLLVRYNIIQNEHQDVGNNLDNGHSISFVGNGGVDFAHYYFNLFNSLWIQAYM